MHCNESVDITEGHARRHVGILADTSRQQVGTFRVKGQFPKRHITQTVQEIFKFIKYEKRSSQQFSKMSAIRKVYSG